MILGKLALLAAEGGGGEEGTGHPEIREARKRLGGRRLLVDPVQRENREDHRAHHDEGAHRAQARGREQDLVGTHGASSFPSVVAGRSR